MAKRKKSDKLARKDHFCELVRRHEPEEDQVMRALGEEADPRGDLIRRVQREGLRRTYWDRNLIRYSIGFDPSTPWSNGMNLFFAENFLTVAAMKNNTEIKKQIFQRLKPLPPLNFDIRNVT